jgi:hypothetical protein
MFPKPAYCPLNYSVSGGALRELLACSVLGAITWTRSVGHEQSVAVSGEERVARTKTAKLFQSGFIVAVKSDHLDLAL